jgi:hypothetical protein
MPGGGSAIRRSVSLRILRGKAMIIDVRRTWSLIDNSKVKKKGIGKRKRYLFRRVYKVVHTTPRRENTNW